MRLLSAFLGLIVTLAGALAGAAHARAYTVEPARYQVSPRFQVFYAGSGTWHTNYHSNPPNPGGNPDTNDAHDSSSQQWSLRFLHAIDLRYAVSALIGAKGRTRVTGHIWHRHIDGLYSFDNTAAQCQVHASIEGRGSATLQVRLSASHHALQLRALIPVSDTLTLLPKQCPGQGDSLDGLSDNYFMPGFSFAGGYGPERWFRSQQVTVPLGVIQRARSITINLKPAPGAAPPKGCMVPQPSYERCRTTGRWHGTLTLLRQP